MAHKKIVSFAVTSIFICFFPNAQGKEPIREWTNNSSGASIKAALHRVIDSSKVELTQKNGKKFTIDIKILSKKDQNYLSPFLAKLTEQEEEFRTEPYDFVLDGVFNATKDLYKNETLGVEVGAIGEYTALNHKEIRKQQSKLITSGAIKLPPELSPEEGLEAFLSGCINDFLSLQNKEPYNIATIDFAAFKQTESGTPEASIKKFAAETKAMDGNGGSIVKESPFRSVNIGQKKYHTWDWFRTQNTVDGGEALTRQAIFATEHRGKTIQIILMTRADKAGNSEMAKLLNLVKGIKYK